MRRRVRILCFGNAWASDDGFGPAVEAHLADEQLPPGVTVEAVPLRGWDALDAFADCDTAIVVDAIQAGLPVGSLNWFLPAAIVDEGGRGEHGVGLGDLLRLLPTRHVQLPQIRILGMEPASLAPACPVLSPPVAQGVPRAARMIREALA